MLKKLLQTLREFALALVVMVALWVGMLALVSAALLWTGGKP